MMYGVTTHDKRLLENIMLVENLKLQTLTFYMLPLSLDCVFRLSMCMKFTLHDLSKYTVPTSFVGIAVPTKVVGMLVVLALPSKVVGMQASNQIQESKWSNFH